jgi:hypothetical protein
MSIIKVVPGALLLSGVSVARYSVSWPGGQGVAFIQGLILYGPYATAGVWMIEAQDGADKLGLEGSLFTSSVTFADGSYPFYLPGCRLGFVFEALTPGDSVALASFDLIS